MNRLVSIDPGARSGIALWMAEQGASRPGHHHGGFWLAEWRAVAMPARGPHLAIARAALAEWDVGIGDTVIVEGQWAIERRTAAGRRARAASGRDVIALVERRCAWEHAGEIATCQRTEVIEPKDWMTIAKHCPDVTPGKRVRWLIAEALSIRTGLDEAAAIGLGLWWLRGGGGKP